MPTSVRVVTPAGAPRTITGAELERIQNYLVALAEELDRAIGSEAEWTVNVSERSGEVSMNLRRESRDGEGSLRIRRVMDRSERTLEHDYFTMSEKLQGKGLADIVARFSEKVVDDFDIAVIRLHANLDVGGYAWLRKGFFPDGDNAVEALKKIYWAPEFVERINGMSNAEVRAFVLSDEFRKYKNIFIGTHWYGSASMSDDRVRAALFGRGPATTQVHQATLHSVMLERLKAAEVRDFQKLIPLLEQQIDALLVRLQGTSLSQLTRGQVNAELRLLRDAQQQALAGALDKLDKRLRLLAEYEAGFEAATLRELAERAGVTLSVAVPTGAAAYALANATPLSATGDLLGPWLRDMTTDEVDLINKAVLRAYSEGWTNDQLVTILKGTKALNYTDGLLTRMGKHNATIVRTAIQHVASTAREQVWRDNPDLVEEYRWVSTLDSRTSQQCRSLDGSTFEVGKGPRPPIHPNCRSTTIPVIEGLLEAGLTRASAAGQVPATMTYYEWLSQQSAEFQQEVLGPGRFKVFREPGMTADKFARLNLNSAFEPLTLEELMKRPRR